MNTQTDTTLLLERLTKSEIIPDVIKGGASGVQRLTLVYDGSINVSPGQDVQRSRTQDAPGVRFGCAKVMCQFS